MNEAAVSAPIPALPRDGELQWKQPDEYHIRSACGRYTVSRITVLEQIHYIAWDRPERTIDGVTIKPLVELGCVKLPIDASEDERKRAIKAMQERCAEHALEEATRP